MKAAVRELWAQSPLPPGQGTQWSWDSAWPLPPGVTVVLVLLLAAWVVWSYWRQRRGWQTGRLWGPMLLRLAALALLLFMLAQVVLAPVRTGLPYLLVLVDDSASMQFVDKQLPSPRREKLQQLVAEFSWNELGRIQVAKALLLKDQGAFLRWAQQRYKLRLYKVSAAARLMEIKDDWNQPIRTLQAQGSSSRLGDALRQVLEQHRGNPPSAVVFLTDGIVTQGAPLDEAASVAQAQGVPVFIVPLGSEAPVRNLAVTDLLVDDVVFRGDAVNFQFRLVAQGYAGRRVRVVLRDLDRKAVLNQISLSAPPDNQPRRCQITYRPQQQGRFRFQIQVLPLEDEETTSDNQITRVVRVRDEKIKVLLVQGYPSFEFRHLKNMLERDTTVQLHTVLQEADWEFSQIDKSALPALPSGREELFGYDVIIWGDVNPELLPPGVLELLYEFVAQRGGGLVLIAGPRYMPAGYRNTPLEPLLPVDVLEVEVPSPQQPMSTPWQLRLTDLGQSSPFMQLGDTPEQTGALWANLAPLYWHVRIGHLRPAARVLAVHPTQRNDQGAPLPIICLQYVGAGRVLFHATDETWRWRFRIGDLLFARYWVQAIRYLSRSKLQDQGLGAELTVARKRFRLGDPVPLRVRFMNPTARSVPEVVVVIQQEQGTTQRVKLAPHRSALGVYEATAGPLPPGNYRAWIASPALGPHPPSADFVVQPPPGELERLKCDFRHLAQVAQSTGGELVLPEEFDRLRKLIPPGHQVVLESLPPWSLWNHWAVVLLFLALLAGEWAWRKWHGLP